MSAELEAYKEIVAEQKEELLDLLAQIGLGESYDVAVPERDDGEPLSELFFAVKVVAENLQIVSEQLKQQLRKAEEAAATIAAQSSTILELSTPVLRVWQGIVVLPLVGAVDTARAGQITAQLLEAIAAHQATTAIIDITGVPVIDTAVAGNLIKTAQAAEMLGAACVITGINPATAQTLVKSGVALEGVTTLGTLEDGLRHAYRASGRKVVAEARPG